MKRVALVVQRISHFEVPLLRLYARDDSISFRVFYSRKPHHLEGGVDEFHKARSDWGSDILDGYESTYCAETHSLLAAVIAWKPHSTIIYGYSWLGGMAILLCSKMVGFRAIYRGTITTVRRPADGNVSHMWRGIRPIILRLFDAYHFGGKYSRNVLLEAGVSNETMFLVPYGVDEEHFSGVPSDRLARAEELRRTWTAGDDTIVFLFVGYLDFYKGPDIALEAFIELKRETSDVLLVFVGGGSYADRLSKRASEAGVSDFVKVTGYLPSRSLDAYYEAADCGLFTSRYDTWGRSVNEAMLCGLPVIASDRMGCAPDLVDGTGWLLQTLEPEEIAQVLAKVIGMTRTGLSALGNECRKRALEYGYAANAEHAIRSVTACRNVE